MDTKKPIVISVEGLIGSGKTTFINECLVPQLTERGYKVKVIKEPVDQWGELLPLFYTNTERWAYTFQTIAFFDRIEESRKVWDESSAFTDIFITERSVASDNLFVETLYELSKLTKMEFTSYYKWCGLWKELLPFEPSLFIYVTPSMDETMKRVKLRARDGEEGVTLDYQLVLKKHHDKMFLDTSKNNVYQLSENFKDEKNAPTIINNILKFIVTEATKTANREVCYDLVTCGKKLSEWVQLAYKYVNNGLKLDSLKPGAYGYDKLAVALSRAFHMRSLGINERDQIALTIHLGWQDNFDYWCENIPHFSDTKYNVGSFQELDNDRCNEWSYLSFRNLPNKEQQKRLILADFVLTHYTAFLNPINRGCDMEAYSYFS